VRRYQPEACCRCAVRERAQNCRSRAPAICTAGLAGSPERGPGEGAGRESVLQLGHNLCVASRLDEVADQLAQQPLAVRHGTSRLLARAEKRRGRIGIIAGVVGGVWMAVSTLRRYPRVPDQLATRRLYEQATGADRDRANADLALVTDRLSPLVGARLAQRARAGAWASRRLVAWVAGVGLQMSTCWPLRPRSPVGYSPPKTATPPQGRSWAAWSPMCMPGMWLRDGPD
jgi:hypothetical protein